MITEVFSEIKKEWEYLFALFLTLAFIALTSRLLAERGELNLSASLNRIGIFNFCIYAIIRLKEQKVSPLGVILVVFFLSDLLRNLSHTNNVAVGYSITFILLFIWAMVFTKAIKWIFSL